MLLALYLRVPPEKFIALLLVPVPTVRPLSSIVPPLKLTTELPTPSVEDERFSDPVTVPPATLSVPVWFGAAVAVTKLAMWIVPVVTVPPRALNVVLPPTPLLLLPPGPPSRVRVLVGFKAPPVMV